MIATAEAVEADFPVEPPSGAEQAFLIGGRRFEMPPQLEARFARLDRQVGQGQEQPPGYLRRQRPGVPARKDEDAGDAGVRFDRRCRILRSSRTCVAEPTDGRCCRFTRKPPRAPARSEERPNDDKLSNQRAARSAVLAIRPSFGNLT